MSIKCQILILATYFLIINAQDRKIFNGTKVDIKDYPFLVKIFEVRHSFHCTGSYIHLKWVLTAFHCVKLVVNSPELVQCCMGDEKMERGMCNYRRLVDKIKSPYENLADIALLKIAPFDLRPNIQVGKMLKWGEGDSSLLGGRVCKVAGWGTTETQKISSDLLSAEVKVLETCTYKYHICVIARQQGPCPGDSGAPLICFNNVIVGVLSGGDKELCGTSPIFADFVQLDIHLDFIYNVIESESSSSKIVSNLFLLILWLFLKFS